MRIKRPDVMADDAEAHVAADRQPVRERKMLGYSGVVAAIAVGTLAYENSQPHEAFSAQEEALGGAPVEQLTPQQATANFAAGDIVEFSTIARDTLGLVQSGDQAGAVTRIADLENAWDDAQPTLEPVDETAWTFIDSEIDDVLAAVRDSKPDAATREQSLTALIASLAG